MLIYVPALLSGIEFQVKKARLSDEYKWKGYDGGWFTDLSMYHHDHVLTSYYYSQRIKNYKETLGIRKDKVLWADSGGFSLATKGANIRAETVIEWQNRNADIAFSLDYPPIAVQGGNRTSSGTFEYISLKLLREHATKSARNNDVFFKLRRPDLKIYNIIHGNRLSYMNEWWKYNGHFDFEGFATGSKPTGDALYQAFNIAFLHNKGHASRIHLLGVSGIRVLPALAYIGKYIDKLSYDSTSYGRGALNRTYMFQDKMNEHMSFGEDYEKNSYTLNCNCPICSKLDSADELAAPGTWPGMLCALHNLHAIKTWTEEMNSIVSDEFKFQANVEKMTGQKYEESMTARAISFWDYYMKYGLEDAYATFFPSKIQNEHTKKVLF